MSINFQIFIIDLSPISVFDICVGVADSMNHNFALLLRIIEISIIYCLLFQIPDQVCVRDRVVLQHVVPAGCGLLRGGPAPRHLRPAPPVHLPDRAPRSQR